MILLTQRDSRRKIEESRKNTEKCTSRRGGIENLTKHKGGVGVALHALIFTSTSALIRH